eukprot:Rmarinus@m.6590
MKAVTYFFILLACIFSAVTGSRMSCPVPWNPKLSNVGDMLAPCGAATDVDEIPTNFVTAGDRLKIGWLSHLQVTGVSRIALVPEGEEDMLDQNVLKVVCFGGDVPHKGCEFVASEHADGTHYETTVTVPTNLKSGFYTLQLVLASGDSYFSCARLFINGGISDLQCPSKGPVSVPSCNGVAGSLDLFDNLLGGEFCFHWDRPGGVDDRITEVPVNAHCDARVACYTGDCDNQVFPPNAEFPFLPTCNDLTIPEGYRVEVIARGEEVPRVFGLTDRTSMPVLSGVGGRSLLASDHDVVSTTSEQYEPDTKSSVVASTVAVAEVFRATEGMVMETVYVSDIVSEELQVEVGSEMSFQVGGTEIVHVSANGTTVNVPIRAEGGVETSQMNVDTIDVDEVHVTETLFMGEAASISSPRDQDLSIVAAGEISADGQNVIVKAGDAVDASIGEDSVFSVNADGVQAVNILVSGDSTFPSSSIVSAVVQDSLSESVLVASLTDGSLGLSDGTLTRPAFVTAMTLTDGVATMSAGTFDASHIEASTLTDGVAVLSDGSLSTQALRATDRVEAGRNVVAGSDSTIGGDMTLVGDLSVVGEIVIDDLTVGGSADLNSLLFSADEDKQTSTIRNTIRNQDVIFRVPVGDTSEDLLQLHAQTKDVTLGVNGAETQVLGTLKAEDRVSLEGDLDVAGGVDVSEELASNSFKLSADGDVYVKGGLTIGESLQVEVGYNRDVRVENVFAGEDIRVQLRDSSDVAMDMLRAVGEDKAIEIGVSEGAVSAQNDLNVSGSAILDDSLVVLGNLTAARGITSSAASVPDGPGYTVSAAGDLTLEGTLSVAESLVVEVSYDRDVTFENPAQDQSIGFTVRDSTPSETELLRLNGLDSSVTLGVPASTVTVLGGVEVSGLLSVDDADMVVVGGLDVHAGATSVLYADSDSQQVVVSPQLSVSGGGIRVEEGVQVDGVLTIEGTVSGAIDVAASGDVNVLGHAMVGGSVMVNGSIATGNLVVGNSTDGVLVVDSSGDVTVGGSLTVLEKLTIESGSFKVSENAQTVTMSGSRDTHALVVEKGNVQLDENLSAISLTTLKSISTAALTGNSTDTTSITSDIGYFDNLQTAALSVTTNTTIVGDLVLRDTSGSTALQIADDGTTSIGGTVTINPDMGPTADFTVHGDEVSGLLKVDSSVDLVKVIGLDEQIAFKVSAGSSEFVEGMEVRGESSLTDVRVSGLLNADGGIEVDSGSEVFVVNTVGDVDVAGSVSVGGTVTISGQATFNDLSTVALDVTDKIIVGDGLSVGNVFSVDAVGNVETAGPINVDTDLTVAETANAPELAVGSLTDGTALISSGTLSAFKLSVTEDLTVDGTLSAGVELTVNSGLSVEGESTFSTGLSILGSASVNGGVIVSSEDVSVFTASEAGDVVSAGTVLINSNYGANSDFVVNGDGLPELFKVDTSLQHVVITGASGSDTLVIEEGEAHFAENVAVGDELIVRSELQGGIFSASGDVTFYNDGIPLAAINAATGSVAASTFTDGALSVVEGDVSGVTSMSAAMMSDGVGTLSQSFSGNELSSQFLTDGFATMTDGDLSAGSASFSGDATVGGSVTVLADATLHGDAHIDGTLSVASRKDIDLANGRVVLSNPAVDLLVAEADARITLESELEDVQIQVDDDSAAVILVNGTDVVTVSSDGVDVMSLTDGVATLTGGSLTGLGAVEVAALSASSTTSTSATADVMSVTTLTDGTASLHSGSISGVTVLEARSFSDGTSVLSEGSISGVVELTAETLSDGIASLHAGNWTAESVTSGTFSDGTATISSGSLENAVFVEAQRLQSGAVSIEDGDVQGVGSASAKTFTDGTALVSAGSVSVSRLEAEMSTFSSTVVVAEDTEVRFADANCFVKSEGPNQLLVSGLDGVAMSSDSGDIEGSVSAANAWQIMVDSVSTLITSVTGMTVTTLTDGTMSLSEGSLTEASAVSAASLTDGTSVLSGGSLSTTKIAFSTLTDGTLSLNGGTLSGSDVTTSAMFTDGTISISSGSINNVVSLTAGSLRDGTAFIAGGDVTATHVTASSLTDGTFIMTSGSIQLAASMEAINVVTQTLSDATASLNNGDFLQLKTVASSSFSDGTATISQGTLSGFLNYDARILTDGTASMLDGSLTLTSLEPENLDVTTELSVDGSATFGGYTTFTGPLSVVGNAVFSEDATFNAGAFVNNTLNVDGAVSLGSSSAKTTVRGKLAVEEDATYTGKVVLEEDVTLGSSSVTVFADMSVQSSSTFADSATFLNTLDVDGTVSLGSLSKGTSVLGSLSVEGDTNLSSELHADADFVVDNSATLGVSSKLASVRGPLKAYDKATFNDVVFASGVNLGDSSDDGVTIVGTAQFAEEAFFPEAVTVGSGAIITGAVTLGATGRETDLIGSLNVDEQATLSSTLTVGGVSTFVDEVTFRDSLIVADDEKIVYRDSNTYIHSPSVNDLTVHAQETVSFQSSSGDVYVDVSESNNVDVVVGGTTVLSASAEGIEVTSITDGTAVLQDGDLTATELTVTGTMNLNGGFAVLNGANTVSVDSAGNLDVSNLSSLDGGIDVNSGSFSVSGAGVTSVAGTLSVDGVSTVSSDLRVMDEGVTLFRASTSSDQVSISAPGGAGTTSLHVDVGSVQFDEDATLSGYLTASSFSSGLDDDVALYSEQCLQTSHGCSTTPTEGIHCADNEYYDEFCGSDTDGQNTYSSVCSSCTLTRNNLYLGDSKRDKVHIGGALVSPRHEVRYVYSPKAEFNVEYEKHSVVVFDTDAAGQDIYVKLPTCDLAHEGKIFTLINTGGIHNLAKDAGSEEFEDFPVFPDTTVTIACMCPTKLRTTYDSDSDTDSAAGNNDDCADGKFVRLDNTAVTTVMKPNIFQIIQGTTPTNAEIGWDTALSQLTFDEELHDVLLLDTSAGSISLILPTCDLSTRGQKLIVRKTAAANTVNVISANVELGVFPLRESGEVVSIFCDGADGDLYTEGTGLWVRQYYGNRFVSTEGYDIFFEGAASSTTVGSNVHVFGGDNTAGSGEGGDVTMTGGQSSYGDGGDVTVDGGAGTTLAVNGGDVSVTGGTAITLGGSIYMNGGEGDGTGGNVEIFGGPLSASGVGNGGDVLLSGGSSTAPAAGLAAGDVTVFGGVSDSASESGQVIISSVRDTAEAVFIHLDGGTAETLKIQSLAGTGTDSVSFVSDNGGVDVDAATGITLDSASGRVGMTTDDGSVLINAQGATTGTVDVNAAAGITMSAESGDVVLTAATSSVSISAVEAAADAISLSATANAGGVSVDAGPISLSAGSVVSVSASGAVSLTSVSDAAGAVTIASDGGISDTIVIQATQGIGASSVELRADIGGVTVSADGNIDDAVNVVSDGGTASVLSIENSSGTNLDAIEFDSTIGGVLVHAGLDDTDAIHLLSNGGTVGSVVLQNTLGTSSDAITLEATVGGVTLTSSLDGTSAVHVETDGGASSTLHLENSAGTSANSILLDAGTGGMTIQTQAAEKDIKLNAKDGAVTFTGSTNAADAVHLVANGGTTSTIRLRNQMGTGLGALEFLADNGGVLVNGGLNNADAVRVLSDGGVSGTIELENTAGTALDSLKLDASAGGVLVHSGLDAANSIHIDVDGGSSGTITVENSLSQDDDAIQLDASAGGVYVHSSRDGSQAVHIATDGGSSASVVVENTLGTTSDAIEMHSTLGGLEFRTEAAGKDVSLYAVAGSVTITGDENGSDAVYILADGGTSGQVLIQNQQSTQIDAIELVADSGGILVNGQKDSSDAVRLLVDGGTSSTVLIENTLGTSLTAIQLESTVGGILVQGSGDRARAVHLEADGGVLGTVRLENSLGTSSGAIEFVSDDGGVYVHSGLDAADAVRLVANGGDSSTVLLQNSAGTSADSVELTSVVGGLLVQTDTLAKDIQLDAELGGVSLTGSQDLADAVYLRSDGGVSGTIRLRNSEGTALDSVELVSDVGGILINGQQDATDAVRVLADGGLSSTILVDNTASTSLSAIDMEATAGGVYLHGGGNLANAVKLLADGGVSSTISISNTAGTGASSVKLASTSGGVLLTTNAASKDIDMAAAAGSVILSADGNVADAVYLTTNSGQTETITFSNQRGTSADAIELQATVGGIYIHPGDDAAQSLRLYADGGTSGTITIDNAQGTNPASVLLSADSGDISVATAAAGKNIGLTASSASVTITALADASDAVHVRTSGGTSETMRLFNQQGTSLAAIELISDDGGIQIHGGKDLADAVYALADGGQSATLSVLSTVGTALTAVELDAVAGGLLVHGGKNANDAIRLYTDGGGSSTISFENSAGTGLDAIHLDASSGGIYAHGGKDGSDAVYLYVDGGQSATLLLENSVGTSLDAIEMEAVIGSVQLSSGRDVSNAMHFLVDGGTSSTISLENTLSTELDAIELQAPNGSVYLRSGGDVASAVLLTADGGTSSAIDISNTEGTSSSSVLLDSTSGGIHLRTQAAGKDVKLQSQLGAVTLTGNENAADAMYVQSNGGTTSTIRFYNQLGTDDDSIGLLADAGGILVTGSKNAAQAVRMLADGGTSSTLVLENTLGSTASALDFEASLGGALMHSSGNIASAVTVSADGGPSSTIVFSNTAGTEADSVYLHSSAGGVKLRTSETAKDVQVSASAGSVSLSGDQDSADAIYLLANGGTSSSFRVHNTAGTGASAIGIVSDDGCILVNGQGNDLRAVRLLADGGTSATVRVENSLGTGLEAIDLESSAGGVKLHASGDAVDAISLLVDGGTSAELMLENQSGTSSESIYLDAAAGGAYIHGGKDAASAVHLFADGGTSSTILVENTESTKADSIELDATLGGVFIQSQANAKGIAVLAQLGAVTITGNQDGASAVYVESNGGTSGTIRVQNQQGTRTDAVELVADAGGVLLNGGIDGSDAVRLLGDGGVSTLIDVTNTLGNLANALNIDAAAGGVYLRSGLNGDDAISVLADGGTTATIAFENFAGTEVDAVQFDSTVGGVYIHVGKDAAQAMEVSSTGGTSGSIHVENQVGTAANAVDIHADAGGVLLRTQSASKDIALESQAGAVTLTGGQDAADAVYFHANGGDAATIRIHNQAGTAVDAVEVVAETGGVLINSQLNSANAVRLLANGGTAATISIENSAGTGVSAVELEATAGG